jgi:hypothetical protein
MNDLSCLNNGSTVIYDKLLESEEQLTKYLKYIRYKEPIPKLQLPQNNLKELTQPNIPVQKIKK